MRCSLLLGLTMLWGCASQPEPPARPAPAVEHAHSVRASSEPSVRYLAETRVEKRPASPSPEHAQRSFEEPLVERNRTRIIVLLYHAFNRGLQKLSVKASDFERQLEWMQNNHVEIVSTSELLDFLEGKTLLPERVAVITIDDGLSSVYQYAWPILERRKAHFTLGIVTGMLEDPKNAPVMTWDQVRQMVASGLCEVASHGHMHRRLTTLSGKLRSEEVELSRDLIEQRIGRAPVAYFYPLGAFSPTSARALRDAGYRAAFRASGAPIAAGSSSLLWLPRLSVFHGESWLTVAHYFTPEFLAKVKYDPKHDH